MEHPRTTGGMVSIFARDAAVEDYLDARPDLTRQFGFFEALWSAQDETAAAAEAYEPASAEETERALRQGRTLFSLARPYISPASYKQALTRIAALTAQQAGLPETQSAALREIDVTAGVSDEGVADVFAGFDAFVESVAQILADERLTTPLLSFLLMHSLMPLVRDTASDAVRSAGRFDWLQWDSGLCPVCGTPASSGIVRDEGELQGGRRWLSCPVCRTQWEYARVRCARCGQRDQKRLEYLFDERDPSHRIHVCKACEAYIPVTFEKGLAMLAVPEVEEVVMVPLDGVAASRGFTPLGKRVAEIPN